MEGSTKSNSAKVSRSEILAIVGGLMVGVGVFLTWYHLKTNTTHIGDMIGPKDLSGWDVHKIMRYLLVAAAVAPLILAYIIARGHALSWPRGEMTAVVAIAAFGMIGYNGYINKPGMPRGEVALKLGFFVALLGSVLMIVGAATRAGGTERPRKPPGTL